VFIAIANVICSLGYGLRFATVSRSTLSCISLGSLNPVPASAGVRAGVIHRAMFCIFLIFLYHCVRCHNVTSAEWQVTLCDSIWHVSSGMLTKGEPLCLLTQFAGCVCVVCVLDSFAEAFDVRRGFQPGQHDQLYCLLRRYHQRLDRCALPVRRR